MNLKFLTIAIVGILLFTRAEAGELQVGFSQLSITPKLIDQWVDVNNDAQFDPDIDLWTDVNGNEKFDAVWMAGFQNQRPAQGIKDNLMAVAVVIDDGKNRIGIVTADTVGLMRKFVLGVREAVPTEWGLDYLMVHATHNHEGPDTQGLWGPSFLSSGVDPNYMQELKQNILDALSEAINNLEPAQMSMALIPTNPLTPIKDKRKPIVIDDDIRALIFTGSGKAFCAGADLSSGEDTFDMSDKGKAKTEVKRDTGGILTLRLFDFKKPLIAAINGAAVGVGVTMTLPMDVRICSEKAKFGFVFAKRGIVPEACSSWFLPKIVGISNALQWCLSGKIFMPQEALEKGLVTEVTSEEKLLERAEEIAADFVEATSSLSVTLIRQMLWKMLGADHPMEAHKIDSRGVYSLGKTGEASEGVMSFLEKREPNFPGKVSKDLPEFYPWWDDKEFK